MTVDPAPVKIVPMAETHAVAVAAIFIEGIATGHATFETAAPDWSTFDAAKLAGHRFVAIDDNKVSGWTAISPTSPRPVYRGVCEVALYVTAAARGKASGAPCSQH
ncbi:MAG: hypothetical protein ABIR57_02715 [Aeromicrobium sp.]